MSALIDSISAFEKLYFTLSYYIYTLDDYLEWCKADGIEPEKPYSGKFNVRISPSFHSQIAIAAKKLNISLNSFVEKSLKDELNSMNLSY